jgi:NAD-dependent deacetylase
MKHLVVLSGAGISAESGLSTFRDADGLWEKYRIEDVCTPEAWQRNPELVLDFYNKRRKQLKSVQPNAAHFALAELEKNFKVSIITQNVDNLHERAGSTNVLHLHGELTKVRSTYYSDLIYHTEEDVNIGDVCEKGYQLRPHIVFFGEMVPMIEPAAEIVATSDILLIIGTSLQVYPAAGLMEYAPRSTDVFLIDKNADEMQTYRKVQKIVAKATEGMQKFKELIHV